MSLLRFTPRFHAAHRAMDIFRSRERWSRQDIERYQLERINELWKSARIYVPYYQELNREYSIPDQFASLQEFAVSFPILDKSKVRSAPDLFLSKARQAGTWQRTGGSTGDPIRVYWSHEAHRNTLRAKYRFEQSHGVDFLEKKAWLWGHHASFATGMAGLLERSQQRAADVIRRRKRFNAYRLGPSEIDSLLEGIVRFQPTSVYGYSSAVYLLAKRAKQRGIQPDALKLCTFTAEPCPDFFIEEAEAAFSGTAAIEYGSVECGLIASTAPDRSLRIREDLVFVETVGAEDGRYPIIVTVLNNPSFPLIRYRIEDVANSPVRLHDSGFATIDHVLGRDNDVVISRTGNVIHSMAIKHVLEVDSRIRRFQVTQSEKGDLKVLIESDRPAEELNPERIYRLLNDFVDGYPIDIRFTPQIHGNLAGKHRWIQSFKSPGLLTKNIEFK